MRKRSLQDIAESVRHRGHLRTASRIRLNYAVKIDDGHQLISGTMTNVSPDGFRITLKQSVPVGTSVTLIRGDDSAPAVVRWSEGLEIGAVLTDPANRPER